MIAGFEIPDEGTIELAGEDVSRLPPYDRPVNTVFQDYALFPHMTVTTFRRVILPAMGTALLAGGLLAFGLSFDEVIVTVSPRAPTRLCRFGSSRTWPGRSSFR